MTKSRKLVFKETAGILIGVAIFAALMLGIYALLGYFSVKVLYSAVLGVVLAAVNFFAMAMVVTLAADRAEKGNAKSGEALVKLSYFGRLAVMAILMFALIKSGLCNVIATVVPLVFTRPALTLAEFFGKGKAK